MFSWKLFLNQKQIVCFTITKEVILNGLKDLLEPNIYAEDFSMSEIIVEGFKIEQCRTK